MATAELAPMSPLAHQPLQWMRVEVESTQLLTLPPEASPPVSQGRSTLAFALAGLLVGSVNPLGPLVNALWL
jgi:hypothetical protein